MFAVFGNERAGMLAFDIAHTLSEKLINDITAILVTICCFRLCVRDSSGVRRARADILAGIIKAFDPANDIARPDVDSLEIDDLVASLKLRAFVDGFPVCFC